MRILPLAVIIGIASCQPGPAPAPSGGEARRIISLLPSFTEVLLSIGCRDRLVGVTSFAPPGAEGIRQVGGLTNPDLEAILAVEPDLVVGIRSESSARLEKKLSGSGLDTLFLPNETLADAMAAILILGERTGRAEAAEGLRRRIEEELARTEEKVKGAPPVKTAVVVQFDPMILAGSGSFLHELVERAGGENIAADSKGRYPQFGLESLIGRGPEVIIDVSESYRVGRSPAEVIRKWERLPSLPARESGRIHPLEAGVPIDPGPRVPLLFRFMASRIHPDRFRKPERELTPGRSGD